MSLYVDHARIRWRGMLMSHLLADTAEELRQAERDLGLPAGCVQYPGTYREHLDVSESKRALAISMGASQITGREIARMLAARRRAAEQ